jgi:hypothetical protein
VRRIGRLYGKPMHPYDEDVVAPSSIVSVRHSALR